MFVPLNFGSRPSNSLSTWGRPSLYNPACSDVTGLMPDSLNSWEAWRADSFPRRLTAFSDLCIV
jgi:hypothetical protein